MLVVVVVIKPFYGDGMTVNVANKSMRVDIVMRRVLGSNKHLTKYVPHLYIIDEQYEDQQVVYHVGFDYFGHFCFECFISLTFINSVHLIGTTVHQNLEISPIVISFRTRLEIIEKCTEYKQQQFRWFFSAASARLPRRIARTLTVM